MTYCTGPRRPAAGRCPGSGRRCCLCGMLCCGGIGARKHPRQNVHVAARGAWRPCANDPRQHRIAARGARRVGVVGGDGRWNSARTAGTAGVAMPLAGSSGRCLVPAIGVGRTGGAGAPGHQAARRERAGRPAAAAAAAWRMLCCPLAQVPGIARTCNAVRRAFLILSPRRSSIAHGHDPVALQVGRQRSERAQVRPEACTRPPRTRETPRPATAELPAAAGLPAALRRPGHLAGPRPAGAKNGRIPCAKRGRGPTDSGSRHHRHHHYARTRLTAGHYWLLRGTAGDGWLLAAGYWARGPFLTHTTCDPSAEHVC